MAVAMPEVVGHPNRVAFSGVLTMVDVPSQRAPSGAKGHLVRRWTRRAAEAALPSLLGPALDQCEASTATTCGGRWPRSRGQRLWGATFKWAGICLPEISRNRGGDFEGAGGWRSEFHRSLSNAAAESRRDSCGGESVRVRKLDRGYRLLASLRAAVKRFLSLRRAMKWTRKEAGASRGFWSDDSG